MGLKVAVIGMAESFTDAPWDDKEWEKWGLPWHTACWSLMDRHFEPHDFACVALNRSPFQSEDYLARLRGLPCLYMQKQYDEIPNAIPFPFEKTDPITGHYYSSSIAYMLALAIAEGAEEIAIYGVDMRTQSEYATQKPNCEYLIGFARGRGIKVHIHPTSPLCKYETCKEDGLIFRDRYGWPE